MTVADDLWDGVAHVARRVSEDRAQGRWGKVIATSPLTVRFAGDTADTRIDMRRADYTPAVNDIVKIESVGSRWVAAYALVAA